MKIYITGLPSGYEVEHLVRLFYPMAPLTLTPPEEGEDCVWAEKKEDSLYAMVREQGQSRDAAAPLPRPVEAGGETVEFTLASLTYGLLRSWTGIRPPWGKMTGVRPVRLIHDKRAAGWTKADIDRFFLERFDCSRQKYDMAKAIADLQEPILKLGSAPKTYSLYLGIPFCPSRCSYCSFVSCNLDRDRKLVQPYVDCLCREVEAIREQADKAGLKLCSIYIGGGTPTTLTAEQLDALLGTVEAAIDLSKLKEFTVEAGRPETITYEKLEVLQQHHIARISINPQSMHAKTLDLIGREHRPDDIVKAFQRADWVGIPIVNADVITGLPEESPADFAETMEALLALDPENITVHTLAVKRASRLVEVDKDFHYKQGETVKKMLAVAQQKLKAAGFRPYYLYRQKHMAGAFENTGYCKGDTPCIYNIRIMEEKQTILALGAGGISKIYYPDENRLERVPNVSNYEIYISRLEEMLDRKEQNIFKEVEKRC